MKALCRLPDEETPSDQPTKEALRKKLYAEATLMLFKSEDAIAREYPVLLVDAGSSDVMDAEPLYYDEPINGENGETLASLIPSMFTFTFTGNI